MWDVRIFVLFIYDLCNSAVDIWGYMASDGWMMNE